MQDFPFLKGARNQIAPKERIDFFNHLTLIGPNILGGRMKKFLICLAAVLLSLAGLGSAQISPQPNFDDCSLHHGNVSECLRDNDCDYDFRTGACRAHNQPGGRVRCGDYDYNQRACQARAECRYVYETSRCVTRSSSGDRCGVYDRWPDLCETTAGCEYDYRSRRCVQEIWGGGTIYSTNVACGSSRYEYQECWAPGEVVSVELLRQESRSLCQIHRTFGAYHDRIWVDNGCRGLFQVRYRRR